MTRRAGLTLVELLVALAVVALAGAVAVPRLLAALPAHRVNGAGHHLAGVFRLARSLAVARGCDVLVQFDFPAPNQYTLAYDTDPAPPNNDHRLTVRDEAILTESLPALYSGIEFTRYGPGALARGPNGVNLPADGVSFQGGVGVFNPDGCVRAGSAYVRPALDAGVTRGNERCVTVTGATGRARLYRWTGTNWE